MRVVNLETHLGKGNESTCSPCIMCYANLKQFLSDLCLHCKFSICKALIIESMKKSEGQLEIIVYIGCARNT